MSGHDDRVRVWIETAAEVVARRGEGERTIARRAREEAARIEREHREGVSAAQSRFEGARAKNEADARERIEQARRAFEADRAVAERRRDAEVGAFDERTQSMDVSSARRLEESLWLADTINESGAAKARQEHDRQRRDLDARARRLADVRESMLACVSPRRRAAAEFARAEQDARTPPPGPRSDGADPAALTPPSGNDGDLDARLAELLSRVRPAPLRPAGLAIPLLAFLAGGAWVFVLWGTDPGRARPWTLWVGLALALYAAFVAVVWIAASRRLPRAASRAGSSIGRACLEVERAVESAAAERDRRLEECRARRERDHERSREKRRRELDEVERRRGERGPALRARHERTIAELAARVEASVSRLERSRDDRVRAASEERDRSVAQCDERRALDAAEAERARAGALAALAADWADTRRRLHAEATDMRTRSLVACPPWDAPLWKEFQGAEAVPDVVSMGRLHVDLDALPGGRPEEPSLALDLPTSYDLPVALDLTARGSLLVLADPGSRGEAIEVLRGAMLRILTALPPGKARFTLIDPVGLGESFAGFMHLADLDPALVGERIWTEPRHIEQRLADLTAHMEDVIQKYLRNEFDSIQAYNQAAGEVAEPFRFLVLADFPAGISDQAGKRLASIASSGSRCGVFTLIAADTRVRPASFIPMAELASSSLVLRRRAGGPGSTSRFQWAGERYEPHELTLDVLPGEGERTDLLKRVGARSKEASRVRVPYELLAPASPWSGDASAEVRVPIGRAGARKLQPFALGRGTAQHALIAGRTGSGKSTFLHVLVTTLAAHYSCDEIELYLVDFKKGVEFKTYASHALPHARVVAVESEREFGLSVLRRLDAELTSRGSLFRDLGVQDLPGYRATARTDPGLPVLARVLLVVDEFQEFFVEDDRLAQEAALLLDRLVRQGRAFGVHVVLGSQTLAGAYSLARSTMGQMGVRIALQCSESDAALIMSEDNHAARLLSRPGEAIYNDASGLVEGNSPFQVAWLDDEARDRTLERVHELARERPPRRPITPPIVFEGNAPARLETSPALARPRALAGPTVLHLGDPVSIKEATCVELTGQAGSHLLIVGQDETIARGLASGVVLSIASRHASRAMVVGVQAASSSDEGRWSLASLLTPISGRAIDARDAAGTLAELDEELRRREASPASPHQPVFLIVFGLHRVRALRRSDDFSFGDDKPASPDQQLARLLRDGPGLGMHVIAWVDSLASLERAMERRTIREFAPRVLMQMSAADSTALIDSPIAGTLGRHRAVLYLDDRATTEKFRPYAAPEPEWIVGVLRQAAGG